MFSLHELQTIFYKATKINPTSAMCSQKDKRRPKLTIGMKNKLEPTCPHLLQAVTASLQTSSILFLFHHWPTDSTFLPLWRFLNSVPAFDQHTHVTSQRRLALNVQNLQKSVRAKQLNQYGMCTEPEMLNYHRLQCKRQSSLVNF